jgi:hypothetical protein
MTRAEERLAVYRQDLASHLTDRLGDVAVLTTNDAVASSSGKALPSVESLDTHLSMPAEVLKKMKHKQKQIVLEKAVDSVTDALASTNNVPLCKSFASAEIGDLLRADLHASCRRCRRRIVPPDGRILRLGNT